MRLSYAKLKLSQYPSGAAVEVSALVDTGAMFMCLPVALATQLGFDVEEVERRTVTLADGSVKKVPVVAPLRIEFENRKCMTEALVLGDEPLIGVIPMEAMDVVVEPGTQRMIVNPKHPNVPVFHAKGFSHR